MENYYVEYVENGTYCQSESFDNIDDAYNWASEKGLTKANEPEENGEFRVVKA